VAIAKFKKMCLDAVDPGLLGPFWAEVLNMKWTAYEHGEGLLQGDAPQPRIWVCRVPEAKSVKHRVHFDVAAADLARLEALGATVVAPEGNGRRWTVMADPEGGEFCVFLRSEVPEQRLRSLVVDSADPSAQGQWWGEVLGARVTDRGSGFELDRIPGVPNMTMDFVAVPEPKTVKNRIHWEVDTDDLGAILDAGATVVRPKGGDIDWHVLADPEGNEFCAFTVD
jgi:Glyoxalase-like domain